MGRQGDLFAAAETAAATAAPDAAQPLLAEQLLSWQQRLAAHQARLFSGEAPTTRQQQLWADPPEQQPGINPLELQPQPLSFWRWPQPQVQGPALYFVIDRSLDGERPLLLYIGETARAEQRWKGEHDCKAYLASYAEALQKAGLRTRLSISFCADAPADTKARRALEQQLIQRWLPPFNKETRGRWATPFHADAT